MDKNLEGKDTSKGETKTTAETKGKESTATKTTESTVRITDTEEFRKELDKALGKATESLNRQVSLSDANAQKAKAEAEEAKDKFEDKQAELADVLREQEELVKQQEDPEITKAYKNRVSLATEKRELARREAKLARQVEQAERDATKTRIAFRATEIIKEYGCPLEVIQSSDNEYQMELEALKWKMAQGQETETPPPVVDAAVSSATGGAEWTMEKIREMSKTPKGLEEFTKNLPEILKASREGKIK